jgi:putative endonuclease
MEEAPYYIYVLFSEGLKKYYTGSSSDPFKRLISHNDPRNRGWTKSGAPWSLIYTEKLQSKKEALIKEKWLKSGTGRDFIKNLLRSQP